jgi:hypothetical protein
MAARQYIQPKDLHIWVQTWWKRDGVRDTTLRSLEASDVGKGYEVRRQPEESGCVDYFIATMREICGSYKWVLRIEDDTIVNRHLLHNVLTWPVPHVEPKFGMGFLSVTNPVLKDHPHIGLGEKLKTPWRNYNGMHFGGGMLWRSDLFMARLARIEACLRKWQPRFAAAVCPSSVFFEDGLRAYFHVPSIVRIDLSIPRSRDGKVVPEARFGSQPFDVKFRR